MSDMTSYKRALRELAEAESQQYINNSSMDHAAAMIEELFRNAQGTVCIFSGHLESQVYNRDELRQITTKFLDKPDNKIDIIMQFNTVDSELALFQNDYIALLQEYSEKVRLFKAETKKLKTLKNHFMVVKTIAGNYALRFEIDTSKHIATGSFNDKNNGEKLYNFFQGCLADGTTPINIPTISN